MSGLQAAALVGILFPHNNDDERSKSLQIWQYCLLVTARLLYMFRTLSASVIRSTKNCSSSHWCMPWTSLLDIYHPDPRHAPVAAATVFSTPDDGRRKRPKHVE